MPTPTQLTHLQIVVNGADVTSHVPKESLRINLESEQRIDTCDMVVEDAEDFSIDRWDIIYVIDLKADITYFWGYITDYSKKKRGVKLDMSINCSSLKVRLQKSHIDAVYIDTDDGILGSLLTDGVPDLSGLFDFSTNVTGLSTEDITQEFRNPNILEAMYELAQRVGANWRLPPVDDLRTNFILNPNLTNDASYYNDDPNGAIGAWAPGSGSWGAGFGESGGGYQVTSQRIVVSDHTYIGVGRTAPDGTHTIPFHRGSQGAWVTLSFRMKIDAGANVAVSVHIRTYDESGTYFGGESNLVTGFGTSWTTWGKSWDLSDESQFPDSGHIEFTIHAVRASGAYTLSFDKCMVEIVYSGETELGADLVTDGDMSNPASWNVGAGWAIAAGVASHTPGNTFSLSQDGFLTIGKNYSLTYTISNRTAGTIRPIIGENGTEQNTNDTFTEVIKAGEEDLVFIPSDLFDGDIDDVSIKEVEGIPPTTETYGPDIVTNGGFAADSDWTKGANWAIADGVATHTAGSIEPISQDDIIEAEDVGEDYRITFTITNRTAGTITPKIGNLGTARSTDNTYSETITSDGVDLEFIPTTDFDGNIDDVSMELYIVPQAPGPYFDGNSAGAEWHGVADGSTSYIVTQKLNWNADADLADFDIDIGNMDEYMEDLSFDVSGADSINSLIVIGGTTYEDVDFEYPADGQNTHFDLQETYYPASGSTFPVIYKNIYIDATPIWTAQTVADRDTGSFSPATVLYDAEDHWLEWQTAPSLLKRSFRVVGRFKRRIKATIDDEVDQDTTGVVLVDTLYDDTITSENDAHARAMAEFGNRSELKEISFTTYEPGLFPGTKIAATDTALGLSADDFIIQRVAMQFLGGGYVKCRVEAGPYVPITEDFLAQNQREINKHQLITSTDNPTPAELRTIYDDDDEPIWDDDESIIFDSI